MYLNRSLAQCESANRNLQSTKPQGAPVARTGKANPVIVGAADSADAGAGRNRRRRLPSVLAMAKAAKEGDVVLKR